LASSTRQASRRRAGGTGWLKQLRSLEIWSGLACGDNGQVAVVPTATVEQIPVAVPVKERTPWRGSDQTTHIVGTGFAQYGERTLEDMQNICKMHRSTPVEYRLNTSSIQVGIGAWSQGLALTTQQSNVQSMGATWDVVPSPHVPFCKQGGRSGAADTEQPLHLVGAVGRVPQLVHF
jgi:hypothetical protein